MEEEDSYLIGHGPCKYCGSSDAAAEYSNGWTHCFSCSKNWPVNSSSNGSVQRKVKMDQEIIQGDYKPLIARGISEEICKRFKYQVGKVPKDYPAREGSALHAMRGKTVHIENFYEDGALVAQKLRDSDKNFAVIGKTKGQLWGRSSVKPGGKVLVVTEGAIDAMSYAEMRKGWPSVSVPDGADSAKKAVKENLDFLESFGKVVFCFDNDEAGRNALESVKGLLSPKKMHIAALPEEYKDLNEALLAGDYRAALQAVMNAEEVRPDGLVSINDIIEDAMKPIEWGLPWFFKELTQATYGRRYRELYGLGGGTGTGKTDVFTEQIAFDVIELKQHVGVLYLEQKPTETVKRIAGKVAGKRFHIPDDGWTEDDLKSACEALRDRVTFFDSFGETEWDVIKTRIRHMNVAEGIRIFYIDHLTAMADTSDEKGSLEQIMKEMAGLADELDLIIHFISHLTTPDGTPHEEGGRVMIRHFKGSRAIGFWSYYMFGLERDQQAEDIQDRQTTTFRILKDRYTGQATGTTFELGYDENTGRILPPEVAGMSPETKPNEMTEGF